MMQAGEREGESKMKNCIGRIVIAVCFVALSILYALERRIANDLMFVTGGATKDSVHKYFSDQGRKPVFTYKKGDSIIQVGWPIPSKTIDYEMEVYDSAFAVRFYIYYDKDNHVSYVFSSSS